MLRLLVRENSPYENVYTLALRGLHDGAMSTTLPMHEKVRMLQQALLDQRRILAENIDRPVETVPQAFTPYKEVLEIYSNGLNCPTTSRSSGRTTTTATRNV